MTAHRRPFQRSIRTDPGGTPATGYLLGMTDTAIFDVDGTLVDGNYQHALAWFRAFRRHDITLPLWRLHRGIGMGGDLFVTHVAGDAVEEKLGDVLRRAWVDEFNTMIGEIRPVDGARPLLEEVKRRGFRLVLASSGKAEHVETFLDLRTPVAPAGVPDGAGRRATRRPPPAER